MAWLVGMTDEVHEWLSALDDKTYRHVMAALALLAQDGPALGRPLVDTVAGSRFANMKELRPPSAGRQTIRVLFAFDPIRQAFLLVAGDKRGDWNRWYRVNIPLADRLYEDHLKELEK